MSKTDRWLEMHKFFALELDEAGWDYSGEENYRLKKVLPTSSASWWNSLATSANLRTPSADDKATPLNARRISRFRHRTVRAPRQPLMFRLRHAEPQSADPGWSLCASGHCRALTTRA